MFLINILIIIFLFLTIYQVYLEISKNILIEGFTKTAQNGNRSTYKDYGSSDSATNALILSQQNAGNISFLKQQVDELEGLNTQVKELKQEVTTMSTQMNQLVEQQATYAAALAGSKPVDVTGTTTATSTNV